MKNVLIRKLEIFVALADRDRDILERVCSNARLVSAKTDLEVEGEPPKGVHVLLSGIACRYKILRSGSRRIVAFLLPGDLCDLHGLLLARMDHSLGTLSDCKLASIPNAAVDEIIDGYPTVTRAVACSSLAVEAISREWLVNNCGRDAPECLGHLLCELYHRFSAVGMVEAGRYSLPITQTDLGDAIGNSSVHVSRTLQVLRKEKLINLSKGSVDILDLARLESFSDFRPGYLHLYRQRPVG